MASLAACGGEDTADEGDGGGGAEEEEPTDDEGADAEDDAEADDSEDDADAATGDGGYPHDTVHMVVPFGEGGGVDTLARGVSTYLPDYLDGVDVVVENRSGGGSRDGSASFEREAEADGEQYIFIVEASTIGAQILQDGDYDVLSWEPIAAFAHEGLFLGVHTDSEFESMEQLVSAAEEGRVTYASSGAGGLFHQQAVIMQEELGVELNHVPFDGSSDAFRAVLGQDVDFIIGNIQNYFQYDDLRALAVLTDERDERLEDVPTLEEEGYDVTTLRSTRGWFAPEGTSEEILTTLEDASRQVFEDEEFKQWAEEAGYELHFYDREDWGAQAEDMAETVRTYEDAIRADME